jgi:probable phosphoglycerate mutase
MSHRLVLVRHGQTEWSASGRHTGRTDVDLTVEGEKQARALEPVLAAFDGCPAWSSPLQRARRTAELAGLRGPDGRGVTIDDDLVEWDYGGYEGLTTAQIRAQGAGVDWTVFKDGVVPGDTPGESLQQVTARARRVLERARTVLTSSDLVLVGHGHALRVLAACWVDADPTFGARLLLSPGSVSVLGDEHGVAAVASWNVAAPVGG